MQGLKSHLLVYSIDHNLCRNPLQVLGQLGKEHHLFDTSSQGAQYLLTEEYAFNHMKVVKMATLRDQGYTVGFLRGSL